MRLHLASAVLLAGLLAPSSTTAQDADQLMDTAIDASMRLMAGSLLCSELVGDAYVSLARGMFAQLHSAIGMSRTDSIIATDDAEKHLRQQQGTRSVRDSIKGNVTEADVELSCHQNLSEALHAAEVANARLAKSMEAQ